MKNSDRQWEHSKVLYHAVSSYQLLEVMLHRYVYHRTDYAVLVLPDFITGKYPQYQKLASEGFFEEVYLFPYQKIPHKNEAQVLKDCVKYYEQCIPWAIEAFERVYVAGAHFYFSLYLIQKNIPFVFFEDAAGILYHPEVLYEALKRNYPLHAALAGKYGLFSGSNSLISGIIYRKSEKRQDSGHMRLNEKEKNMQDFSVEDTLENLDEKTRKKVVRFFVKHSVRGKKEGILLTQQFANLGIMSEEQQWKLYKNLAKGRLKNIPLFVKKHPDDTLDYGGMFPGAKVIGRVFPAELLPYVFRHKPDKVYTFDSTACRNLKKHFEIITIERAV